MQKLVSGIEQGLKSLQSNKVSNHLYYFRLSPDALALAQQIDGNPNALKVLQNVSIGPACISHLRASASFLLGQDVLATDFARGYDYFTQAFTFIQTACTDFISSLRKMSSSTLGSNVFWWSDMLRPFLTLLRIISHTYDLTTSYNSVSSQQLTQQQQQQQNTSVINLDIFPTLTFDDVPLVQKTAFNFANKCIQDIVRLINGERQNTDVREQMTNALVLVVWNGILTHFSFNSTIYTGLFNITHDLDIIQLPRNDHLIFSFCHGKHCIISHKYQDANNKLVIALESCISYPTTTKTKQLYPNHFGEHIKQHNIALLVSMLCPLRLLTIKASGNRLPSADINDFSPYRPISLTSFAAQNQQQRFNTTGLFSPQYLISIGLPIYAALSQAVLQGDIYEYAYLLHCNTRHFIRLGTFALVQLISSSVWLRFIWLYWARILPVTPHEKRLHPVSKPLPHILYFDELVLMTEVYRARFFRRHPELSFVLNPETSQISNPMLSMILCEYSIIDIQCIVSNLIYDHRITGYIHHSSRALVLRKSDPFS